MLIAAFTISPSHPGAGPNVRGLGEAGASQVYSQEERETPSLAIPSSWPRKEGRKGEERSRVPTALGLPLIDSQQPASQPASDHVPSWHSSTCDFLHTHHERSTDSFPVAVRRMIDRQLGGGRLKTVIYIQPTDALHVFSSFHPFDSFLSPCPSSLQISFAVFISCFPN